MNKFYNLGDPKFVVNFPVGVTSPIINAFSWQLFEIPPPSLATDNFLIVANSASNESLCQYQLWSVETAITYIGYTQNDEADVSTPLPLQGNDKLYLQIFLY